MQTCHPLGDDEGFVPTMPRVAHSQEMRDALDLSRRVAGQDLTVLLTGESGTGRRQLAKWIHDISPRRSGPFVSLSCFGLGEGELGAEIFGDQLSWNAEVAGYRIGLVDAARQGTLYIEEVADLGPKDQRTLLRLLRGEVAHDLRLICSTRYPLASDAIRRARLHPALFFRIASYPIPIPPIRRRSEDLPALARILLAEVEPTRRMVLEPETLTALMHCSFPGNLVELRSALIWATLMTDGISILPDHLPPRIHESSLSNS
jgi:DNA-binding NtrC family response regulator